MFTVRSLLSLANQPSLLPGSALHTSSTLGNVFLAKEFLVVG